jgi:putative oxidoreductase
MALALMAYGPGNVSLDHLLRRIRSPDGAQRNPGQLVG